MEKFLFQLSWMRRYSDALLALHSSGHFNYFPEYSTAVSVFLSLDDVKERVLLAESFLSEWTLQIDKLRRQHIYVNFLDIKRCKHIYSCLSNLSNPPSREHLAALAKALFDAVMFINPVYAYDNEKLMELTASFADAWLSGSTLPTNGLTDILGRMCMSLDKVCSAIPRYCRRMPLNADLSEYGTVTKVCGGRIYASQAPSPEIEYQRIFALYGHCGVFPQWETCLICTQHTSQEQIFNFIYRWNSIDVANCHTIYSVLETHKLGYAIQDAAIRLLRELLSVKSKDKCPLLLSCTVGSHICPLVSQFQNNLIGMSKYAFIIFF